MKTICHSIDNGRSFNVLSNSCPRLKIWKIEKLRANSDLSEITKGLIYARLSEQKFETWPEFPMVKIAKNRCNFAITNSGDRCTRKAKQGSYVHHELSNIRSDKIAIVNQGKQSESKVCRSSRSKILPAKRCFTPVPTFLPINLFYFVRIRCSRKLWITYYR